MSAPHTPSFKKHHQSGRQKDAERIKELEAHTPTQDAYNAACKALAHWRKEAKRLGKIAGVTPREMKR